MNDGTPQCKVCYDALDNDLPVSECVKSLSLMHSDCYEYIKGCADFGCEYHIHPERKEFREYESYQAYIVDNPPNEIEVIINTDTPEWGIPATKQNAWQRIQRQSSRRIGLTIGMILSAITIGLYTNRENNQIQTEIYEQLNSYQKVAVDTGVIPIARAPFLRELNIQQGPQKILTDGHTLYSLTTEGVVVRLGPRTADFSINHTTGMVSLRDNWTGQGIHGYANIGPESTLQMKADSHTIDSEGQRISTYIRTFDSKQLDVLGNNRILEDMLQHCATTVIGSALHDITTYPAQPHLTPMGQDQLREQGWIIGPQLPERVSYTTTHIPAK